MLPLPPTFESMISFSPAGVRMRCLPLMVCLVLFAGAAVRAGAWQAHRPAPRVHHGKAWVDSMKRLLYPRYDIDNSFYRDPLNMLRYINVSAALGDYYMARYEQGDTTALRPAMKYYSQVACLSDGTDSDLGESEYLTYNKRDSVCREVASIYSAGLWPADDDPGIYTGRFIDVSALAAGNNWQSPVSDSEIAYVEFVPSTISLTADARQSLNRIAAYLLQNGTARKIVVEGNACCWLYNLQMAWCQVNAVIEYLTQERQLERNQFIFRYMPDRTWPSAQHGDADLRRVLIRYAAVGEDGPNNVAPPHPWFVYGSGD